MNGSSPLNFRDHIKPLFIADSIFTIGIVILILLWQFGDDSEFLGGLFYNEKALMTGLGLGFSIAGGILLLNSILKLIRARRRHH